MTGVIAFAIWLAEIPAEDRVERSWEMIGAQIEGQHRRGGRVRTAAVNVTNHCNSSCARCFVFRDGNPNEAPSSIRDEMDAETMLETLAELRDRYGIEGALWMGGEPLLRKQLVARGIELFRHNTVTTNGTRRFRLPRAGAVHGDPAKPGPAAGVRRRAPRGPRRLDDVLFYVPRRDDFGSDVWADNEERADAVREVMRLRDRYPDFVRNSRRSFEPMLPANAKRVTAPLASDARCVAMPHLGPRGVTGAVRRAASATRISDSWHAPCGSISAAASLARREEDPMTDFLSNYSIQYWLESCPQGYLNDTEYGHEAGAAEPGLLFDDDLLRQQAIRTTTQLVVGERCALSASSGLINAAPDEAAKRFLATQTLDEARHVEIFTQRMFDLGVKKADLESTLEEYANPNLVHFAECLLEKVDAKDFIPGVVGQNIILEGMAFSVFEMMYASNQSLNPKFAQTLSGTIADERRHVGFGENYIGALIQRQPEKKPEIEKMQKEMSYHMLATFSDAFRGSDNREELARVRQKARELGRESEGTWQGAKLAELDPKQMEGLLSDTVLREFKVRLARIGIDYQTPSAP